MLEPAGNILQDLDGIFARLGLVMTTEQPGRKREHDDHECVSEDTEEEPETCC